MEKIFILTGWLILALGVIIGLLLSRIFEIENEEDEENGSTGKRA